jgi:hypothetical protein
MATGIFKLRDQLYGLVQKAWSGPVPNYGAYFNGSSQYLTWPSGSSVAFGTGNFTFECWVYLTATPTVNFIIDFRDASHTTAPCFLWGDVTSGVLTWDTNGAGTTVVSGTGATWSANTWYHIAYVRNGTVGTLYQNGVSIGTGTDSTNYSVTPTTSSIGARYASSFYYFQGYISNLRIVKGTALYTANFTPSTSPLTAVSGTQLLTLQNSTIVDNSTNAYTITNTGSIVMSSQAPFNNAVATPSVDYLVVAGGGGAGNGGGGGGAGGLLQGISNVTTGTSLTVTVGGGGAGSSSAGTVGTSGQNSVFSSITSIGGGGGGSFNSGATTGNSGVSGGSGGGGAARYSSFAAGAAGQATFGQGNAGGAGNSTNSQPYAGGGGGGAGTVGLISTTDTSASSANGGAGIASSISGTVASYAGGGAGGTAGGAYANNSIGGVGGGGNINTAGSANTGGGGGSGNGAGTLTGSSGGSGIVIISYPDTYNAPSALTGTYTASTSGSGSFYLNGSSYLVGPTTSTLNFGTGNYTIEFWIYPTVTPATLDIFLSASAGGNNAQIGFSPSQYLYSNFPSIRTGTSTSIKLNQWNHVALVRSGTNVALFSNGTRVGTATDSTSTSYTNYYIGTYNAGPGSYNAENAYMSNIRMSNVAVYDPTQTTYTVPTAPFVAVSSTVLLMSSVSGAYLADSSSSSLTLSSVTGTPSWNQLSPFATGLGYKNRVYTWTASGTVTF